MIKKKKIYILIFLFSITLQAVSTLQYLLKNEETYIINWFPQYTVIVLVSIMVTFVQYLNVKTRYRYALFLFRFILLLIVHFPVGIYIGLKQMFFTAFLLDLAFFLSFPLNFYISFISFLTIYTVSIISQFRTMKIPFPFYHDLIYITLYTILIIFIFTMFKYFFDSYSKHENQVNHLNQTIKKLTDANSGFQHYIRIAEEQSSEDERNRIIREIHDSIGYTLTTIMMLSTSIIESGIVNNDKNLKKILININTYAKSGLNDMRIILRVVKVKKEFLDSDLIQLKRMVKAFEKATAVKVRLELGNSPNNFKKEISHLAFRVIQEGMINSLRHGQATKIDIFLFIENRYLNITICDNGQGFKEMTPGLGLKGINERLNKVNGNFSLVNNKAGVTLSIRIPMDKVVENEAD